ncbi:MAG: OprO/OprP family phosphate-selective porin [Gammaproteobacteria bacterium]|nr:OprO/OprP family phosphate-selective porin [Gammaproteobacteria bacterium]
MQPTQTTLAIAIAAALAAPATFAETATGDAIKAALKPTANWKGSLILEGLYFDRSSPGELTVEGMPSGGHDHGFKEGLHAGHNEVVVSGNLNDKLKARVTTAISEAAEGEGSEPEVELEEAFVETQGLGQGVTVKAGRFFSDVGYLSSKHNHEWDFADAPLVYKGMFGTHTNDDGVQLSYVAPTDQFVQVGTEVFAGEKFPSGKTDKSISAATLYAKTGGDIGTDHSWQAGIGHWRANDIRDRSSAAHDHGGGAPTETPRFSGDSKINTVNALYKWAPHGNAKERNLKLQAEYFQRDESGTVDMVEADGTIAETTAYNGKQDGWYAQAVYQFKPHWRVGVRHGHLKINNSGADEGVLEEAGLHSEGHTPKRNSLMLDYSPREYSRWRLQLNEDKSTPETDQQVILQYTHSFGSHGAHGF